MNFKELAPGPTDRASDVSHSTAFDASDGASRPIAPTDTSRPGPSESIGAGLRFVPQSRLLGGSGEREVHTMDSEGSERQTADQASPTESVRTDNSIVPPREEVQRIYQEAGVGPDGTKDLGTGDVRNVEFSATLQQSHQDVNGVNQDAGEGDREDNGDGDTILRVNVTDSDEGENDGHELVVEPDADRLLDASGTGGEGGGRDKPPGTGGSEGSDDGIDGENGDSDVNLNGDGNTESIPDDSVIGNANGISEEGTGEQDAALIEIASGDDVPQGTPTEPEPQADNVGGVTGESTETELPSVEDPDPYGIKDVYKNIAVDIVGTLDEGDISVVTGPWRSGKSTTLIPEMVTVLIESGQEVVSTQGFDFMDDSERLVQGLPDLPNRNGVIIVDEAGIPPSNQDQLNETLAALRDKGYTKVVAVLPHHIDAADVGLSDLASIWGRAVNGEGEHDIPMTPIPRAELTNPSAEIFVRDRAEENKLIRPSTDDAIAYVLANVPHTLSALDSVAGSGDLGQTLNAFYRYLTTAEGSMPETERQQLIAKVGQDRLDLESGIQISIGDGHYQPPDDGRERVFIGKQLIDASEVEVKDEGIQDQHPHDVQEIVNGALKELAFEREAGRTGVEGFDPIDDTESDEVVEPVDSRVQALVDEALSEYVAERNGQVEGEVVSETTAVGEEPVGTTSPVDVYFAEGGKVGDAIKIDLPGEGVYGQDEYGIKAWKDELDTSKQPVTEFVGIPLSIKAPNECVDGRTNWMSQHGPMMPGGSLFAEVILAVDSGSPFDEEFIGVHNQVMAEKGYRLGVHYGSHHNIDSGICDCGFADRLQDIMHTSVNQRELITDRLLGVYDANPGAFAMEREKLAELLGNVFDKMDAYIGDKVMLSGEMLIRKGIEDGAVQEMVVGDHDESAAIVNLDPTVTFDTNLANSRGQQAFNLDLPHAVAQADALGVEPDFATAASLILYAATEIVLVEQQGKPALPIIVNTVKQDPHTSEVAD